MEAAEFVTALQDYLEEQRLSEPRGTVRLRHIESHDSLRAQGWYGVRGMETFYALSAWIDGIPMIYHGMEIGHSAELARINEIRRRRPELSRGLANYRAVECDVPGVFTCLRQLGQAASVVVINFNRQPITANLTWPQGRATVTLGPLGYTLLPEADIPARNDAEWFVDTVEGRLCDRFDVSPQIISGPHRSGIYWRPQCGGAWWSNEMLPLAGQLGTKGADGRWEITRFSGPVTDDVRLLAPGRISGASGSPVEIAELPPAPDPTAPVAMGGVTSRCVGSEYIISNRHYSVTLRRQGGMIRQLRTAHGVVAENQDLYGERAYFPAWGGMRASEDVESGIRLWREGEALHLSFTGQIRGVDRFALKRPALFYRNEFAFTDSARFTERWAFRTEQDFHDQDALLAFCIGRVGGEKFTFGKLSGEIEDGELRIGQTNGPDLPAEIRFSDVLVLQDLHMPSETDCHLFMRGRSLFFTLLDGAAASLSSNRWYEFSADWNTAP
jgi:hypothetical protein